MTKKINYKRLKEVRTHVIHASHNGVLCTRAKEEDRWIVEWRPTINGGGEKAELRYEEKSFMNPNTNRNSKIT